MEPIMIGSTAVLRNTDLDPLSDRQLLEFAPTIFAKNGIPGVSERYGYVSSKSVIDAMRDSGFEPVEVRQSRRRDTDRMPFTKHMMKFRPAGKIKGILCGDVVPQVVMLNSHDRSSGFHLHAGLYRLVCSNGLMVSDGASVEPIKVPHTARMVQNVLDRSKELIKCMDGVYRLREDMLSTMLSEKQALAFATQALTVRPPRVAAPDPASLLEARRPEDEEMSLWHIFNRVQENMLRGGLTTTAENGKQVTTRGIGRIERDVQINSGLWSLAAQTIQRAADSAKKQTAKKPKPSKKSAQADEQQKAELLS